uniref:Uncharacterized protein n=1 Tax=Rhizophora mucronata TaxID=61149 RepID=A0A2P2PER5_RHIMU
MQHSPKEPLLCHQPFPRNKIGLLIFEINRQDLRPSEIFFFHFFFCFIYAQTTENFRSDECKFFLFAL